MPGMIYYIIHLCSYGDRYEASFSAQWLRAKTIMRSLCYKEIGKARDWYNSFLNRDSQICGLLDFPFRFSHPHLLIFAICKHTLSSALVVMVIFLFNLKSNLH